MEMEAPAGAQISAVSANIRTKLFSWSQIDEKRKMYFLYALRSNAG